LGSRDGEQIDRAALAGDKKRGIDGIEVVGVFPRSGRGDFALGEPKDLRDQTALGVIANPMGQLARRSVERIARGFFDVEPPPVFAIRPDWDAMETDRAKRGVPFSLGG
jgi:hypothetical protein